MTQIMHFLKPNQVIEHDSHGFLYTVGKEHISFPEIDLVFEELTKVNKNFLQQGTVLHMHFAEDDNVICEEKVG